MSDSFEPTDAPRYTPAPLERLIEVAGESRGAELLLEYQDAALEIHDRIADAINEPAAGYWIGTEHVISDARTYHSEHNPLSEYTSLNAQSVLTPILRASQDVRWTVISFRADGTMDARESSESGTEPRGLAEFRLPTPAFGRIWATAVGRRAMTDIRNELKLSWAVFEQRIGPPSEGTIAAAKRRLGEQRGKS